MRAAAVLFQIDGDAVRSARKCPSDVAVGLREFEHHIAGSTAVGTAGLRRKGHAAVGYGRHRIVVDCDQGSRILGDAAALCDDDRHGLTDKRNFVLGENELGDIRRKVCGPKLQGQTLLAQQRRQIREHEDRSHTRQHARLKHVHAANHSVSVGTSNERRFQHVRKLQVVDEAATAAEEWQILNPLERPSDVSMHACVPALGQA
jgi:hypothetical protein